MTNNLKIKINKTVNKPETLGILDMVSSIVPVFFLMITFLLECSYPAYNRIQNTISELVWGPNGWGLTVLFFIFGLSMMGLALRLNLVTDGSNKAKIGIALLFLIGIGFIIIALFPTKAPGAAQSVKALVHLQTARAISAVFPMACFLIASGLKKDEELKMVRWLTLVAGGFGLMLVLPGALASLSDTAWLGAIERMIVSNGLLWMEIIGIYLLFPQIRTNLRLVANRVNRLLDRPAGQAAQLIPVRINHK